MIGRITGTLIEKHPPQVVVDVHGMGYEIDVPMSTFYNLPAIGERVALHTHLVVREDAQLLYGFGSEAERATFRQLIRITGVGAKMALAVLSGMNANELAQAVAMQETGRLTKIPGIGKKTAERLLLELKGRLADALPGAGQGGVAAAGGDVLNALLALGYNEREAVHAVRQLAAATGVEDGIRQALKLLSKT
ncbi:Holliday junction ATP-dependent DNA helicase RuvA [Sulfuriferula plumbiphila]|uniref:Holliday junction branch migration complex subunit RuvA n=1 Tax=Sulfuriferula plumbiphila TaxID=171865 RepID=A0A512LAR5_9PROT|nr:Holliday junction branch migration protein RuvA [Sulfuriferula plumbiphila]BBP03343.1 Holliday junction ATP-dependent DNA helicase RuvA [Sulfuriferula plumbiphila]GEP31575.1 Holliday junction ATP-dependent DNA helicase RuvA [Sulfuriferula plumbiphila]